MDSLPSCDSESNNIFSGRLKKHYNIFTSQKRPVNTFSDEASDEASISVVSKNKKKKPKLNSNMFLDIECDMTRGYNSDNSVTSEEYFDNEYDVDDNFIDNGTYSSNLEMYYKLNNDYINNEERQ